MNDSGGAPDILVVGAGVVGLCAALNSARSGLKVQVIEARCAGAGASGRSGALIRSNCETDAECRLAQRSLETFRNWESVIGGDAGFRADGVVELVAPAGVASLRERTEMQRRWGVAVDLANGNRIETVAPEVSCPDVAAAAFQPDGGFCEPPLVLRSLVAAASAAGVEFMFGTSAIALMIENARCVGVRTDTRDLAAGAVVIAAGTGAAPMLGDLAQEFGLVPKRSTLAVFHADTPFTDGPAILDKIQGAWFRPMPDGGLLVGMGLERSDGEVVDLAAADAGEIRRAYAAAAAHRYGMSPWAPCRGLWSGRYVLSRDNLPVIGKHPEVADAYLAVGDCGGAFKLAPAMGEDLARLIMDGALDTGDIGPLAPDRLIEDRRDRASHAG